jgi:hypothetical protein
VSLNGEYMKNTKKALKLRIKELKKMNETEDEFFVKRDRQKHIQKLSLML